MAKVLILHTTKFGFLFYVPCDIEIYLVELIRVKVERSQAQERSWKPMKLLTSLYVDPEPLHPCLKPVLSYPKHTPNAVVQYQIEML